MSFVLTADKCLQLNLLQVAVEYPIGCEVSVSGKDKEGNAISKTANVVGYEIVNEELTLRVRAADAKRNQNLKVDKVDGNIITLLTEESNLHDTANVANNVCKAVNNGLGVAVSTTGARDAKAAFALLPEEIKALRQAAKLTQVDVALELGLSKGSSAAIGDWEAGRLGVPAKHQARLLALLRPAEESNE